MGGVNAPSSSRQLSSLAGPLWQGEGDQVLAPLQRALMPECSETSDLVRTPSAREREREIERERERKRERRVQLGKESGKYC